MIINKNYFSGDPKEMKKVALTSIASCFFLYFIASVFGYMTFYNYVQSDLLLTYNHSDPRNALTLVVRVCVLIGVMLTLPLTHYPVSSYNIFIENLKTCFRHEKLWTFYYFHKLILHGNAILESCAAYWHFALLLSLLFQISKKYSALLVSLKA